MGKKNKYNGWITVHVKNSCGCCTEEMKFKSVSSAEAAFTKVGLGSSMKVVDDTGEEHTQIDTFYGFSVEEKKQKEKSLGYLFNKLGR